MWLLWLLLSISTAFDITSRTASRPVAGQEVSQVPLGSLDWTRIVWEGLLFLSPPPQPVLAVFTGCARKCRLAVCVWRLNIAIVFRYRPGFSPPWFGSNTSINLWTSIYVRDSSILIRLKKTCGCLLKSNDRLTASLSLLFFAVIHCLWIKTLRN